MVYETSHFHREEDFQASLREKCTEEIKFDLIVNKIVGPEQRALAEIEIERRREENELSQVKADLADYQKRVRRQKWAKEWVINTAAVGVMVAAASAIAAWLE